MQNDDDAFFSFIFRGFLLLVFFLSAASLYACGPIRSQDVAEYQSGVAEEAADRVDAVTGDDPFGDPFGDTPAQPPSTDPAPQPPPEASQPPQPAPEPSAQGGAALASQRLAGLSVNDNFSNQPKYDRNRFKHWSDVDGNRCDSRQDVLIRQSIGNAQVDAFGCQVVTGDWYSEYDGFETTNPGDLDIDHVVALGEGWRAGAWQWDDAKREQFANDLNSRQLIAVSAKSNRSKSDKRPDEWMPERSEYHCQFLFDWVEVKYTWGLTVATPEKNFIAQKLQSC